MRHQHLNVQRLGVFNILILIRSFYGCITKQSESYHTKAQSFFSERCSKTHYIIFGFRLSFFAVQLQEILSPGLVQNESSHRGGGFS